MMLRKHHAILTWWLRLASLAAMLQSVYAPSPLSYVATMTYARGGTGERARSERRRDGTPARIHLACHNVGYKKSKKPLNLYKKARAVARFIFAGRTKFREYGK